MQCLLVTCSDSRSLPSHLVCNLLWVDHIVPECIIYRGHPQQGGMSFLVFRLRVQADQAKETLYIGMP